MSPSKTIATPSGGVVCDNEIDRMFEMKNKVGNETSKRSATPDLVSEEQPAPKKRRTQNGSVDVTSSTQEPPELFFKTVRKAINVGVTRPSKEMTGVGPCVTEVCATISKQIYEANTKSDFNLSDSTHQAEVLEFTNHGPLKDSVPPFVIVASGDAIILGWRGSSTVMDWASDFSYAPVSSARWNGVTPYIRAHSAYAALVESDLSLHEKMITDAIVERKCKNLILTGHSLAGGMAQVAHLYVEGQMQTRGTVWSKLARKITCRTVAFCGPMTTLNLDIHHEDDATNTFMEKISENSCNIVFNTDAVPHAVGDIEYLNSVVEAVLPDLAKNVPGGWLVSKLIGAESKLESAYDNLIKEKLKDLFPVLVNYHQVGKIIYYNNEDSEPVILRDSVYLQDHSNVPEFRGYSNMALPESTRKESAIDQLTNAHLFFPTALAYNVVEDKKEEQ